MRVIDAMSVTTDVKSIVDLIGYQHFRIVNFIAIIIIGVNFVVVVNVIFVVILWEVTESAPTFKLVLVVVVVVIDVFYDVFFLFIIYVWGNFSDIIPGWPPQPIIAQICNEGRIASYLIEQRM